MFQKNTSIYKNNSGDSEKYFGAPTMQRLLMLIYVSNGFQRNFSAKKIIHHYAATNHKQPCLIESAERSEKRKNWNFERKKTKENSKLLHSTDFRTVYGIILR